MKSTMRLSLLMSLMVVLIGGLVLAGHGNGGVPQVERNNMSLNSPQNGTNISSNYFQAGNGSATLSSNSTGRFDGRFLLNMSTGNHTKEVYWEFENTSEKKIFSNASPSAGDDGSAIGNVSWRFQVLVSDLNDGVYNVTYIMLNQSQLNTTNNGTGLGNITQVRIDRTAPNISYNLTTPTNNSRIRGTRQINISAEDATTQVRNITIYLNNGSDEHVLETCQINVPGRGNCTVEWDTKTGNQSFNKNISYLFYALANDSLGNVRQMGAFNVTVDNLAPALTKETTSTITASTAILEVTTDESANCRFSTKSDDFDGMTVMETTGGSSHTHRVTGLSEGTKYTYFMRCQDTAEDNSGNKNEGNLVQVQFTTTSSGGGSGSGGGGVSGGGGGAVSSVAGQFAKGTWQTLPADQEASLTVAKSENVGIGKVTFVLDTPGKGVVVEVKKSSKTSLPKGTPDLKSTYKVIEIKTTNVNQVGAAEIEFSVTKAWLEENKVTKEGVALYRLVGGNWVKLGGTVLKEDATVVYYKASTPGFSFFAIAPQDAAPAAPVEAAPAAQPAPTKTEPAAAQPAMQKSGGSGTVMWVVAVLALVAVVAYVLMRKKGKK